MASTTTVTLNGTITIGEGTNTVQVPVHTTIPPTKPNDFVLDASYTDPTTAPQLPIGSYIQWAANQFGVSLTDADLPEALQTVTAAIMKLHIDSTGPYGVQVELGTMSGGKFQSTWKPVDSIPLSLGDLNFVVTNMTDFANVVRGTGTARLGRPRALAQA